MEEDPTKISYLREGFSESSTHIKGDEDNVFPNESF